MADTPALPDRDPAATMRAVLDFVLEADRLKGVERRNWLADGSRRENTAEHSWHLGIMAMVLAPFASEPIDVGRAVAMALVHDIVEIDAGDTFAYAQMDPAVAAAKVEAEQRAADRLFGLLPPATAAWFRELWDDYEAGGTPEARFVMAVDRSAPMLLNITEGGSAWREHGISREKVIARNGRHVEHAIPGLWADLMGRLDAAVARGAIPEA